MPRPFAAAVALSLFLAAACPAPAAEAALKILRPPAAGGAYVAEFWQPWPAERLAVLEGGKPAPFRVLSSGPGDARKVAFLCRDPGKVTFVASGEKPADGGKGAWMERKGLLLTTWPLPPEPRAENLADMRQTLARCGQDRPYGCGFVPNVYHGHNVFGPSDAYVSRYEGMINCPDKGEYVFATSSDDASFLLVDGREVVSWPGGHGAVWDARHQKKIALEPGWHRFAYYHVNFGGGTCACAAWKTPKGDKIVPIPAGAFGQCPPVLRDVVMADGAPLVVAENSAALWAMEPPLLQYRFSLSDGAKARWLYGDGNAGGNDRHLFLSAEPPTVTAVYRRGGAERRVSAQVGLEMDWAGLEKLPAVSLLKAAEKVSAYDFPAMGLQECGAAVDLLLAADELAERKRRKAAGGYAAPLLAASRAYLARAEKTPPATAAEKERRERVFLLCGELLRAKPETLDEAVALYRAEIARPGLADAWRAEVIRQYGDTLFYYVKDLAGALNQYDIVVGRYAGALADNIVRVTQIKIGDIYWRTGRAEPALNAYRAAEEMKLYKRDFAQDTVRKGALYKAVDDFLRRKEYPAAEEWLDVLEWEYPLEKVDGYATIARARLALAQNRPAEAEQQLRYFVDTGRRNAYTAEALRRLHAFYREAGRRDEAAKVFERLKKDFPDAVFGMKE